MTLELPQRAQEYFTEDELPEQLGWIAWLSPRHQRLFAGELYVALAAFRDGAPESDLEELLDSWRATAELDRAPDVQAEVERNRQSSRWASWTNG